MRPRQGSNPFRPAGRAAVERAGRLAFAGFRLRVVARTGSTQDQVLAAARAGTPEGYCIVAAEQTAGRGRLGRSWFAPPGAALLTSILLRPAAASLAGIPLAAGIALAEAVEAASGVSARLRWPNDLLVGGGKLAGILAESVPSPPGEPAAVALGFGVNLAVESFPEGLAGASLHRLANPAPNWAGLLSALLPALATGLDELARTGIPGLRPRWLELSVGLGQPVRARDTRGELCGTVLDLDHSGGLLVATDSGTRLVIAGEVSLEWPCR